MQATCFIIRTDKRPGRSEGPSEYEKSSAEATLPENLFHSP